MIAGTLYVRVCPQDRGRGFLLLASWTKPVVQRNCEQLTTLGAITRASLNKVIATLQTSYNPSSIVDVTDASVAGQLRKLFGENIAPAAPAVKE